MGHLHDGHPSSQATRLLQQVRCIQSLISRPDTITLSLEYIKLKASLLIHSSLHDYLKMSFGYSVGDVLAVGQLCWKVYKKCKESPGNYAELASEVGALHNVVKETEELLSQQALTTKQENKLLTCRQGCESVLKDLDALLVKYETVGTNARRTFDRMGFGMQDMTGIRLRLISNTSLLDTFNNLCVGFASLLSNPSDFNLSQILASKAREQDEYLDSRSSCWET